MQPRGCAPRYSHLPLIIRGRPRLLGRLSTALELVAAEVDSGFFPSAPCPCPLASHRVMEHVGSAPTLIQRRERGSVMRSCEFVHSGARADAFRRTSIALTSGDPVHVQRVRLPSRKLANVPERREPSNSRWR